MMETKKEGVGDSAKEALKSSRSVRTQADVINPTELALTIAAKWKIILLAAIFGALLLGCYHYFFLKPSYETSASIFITNRDNVISLSDMQLSSSLTEDYSNILKSNTVLQSVIEKLELDMDYRTLSHLITISNPTDSHIIVITVSCWDKELCRSIANSLLDVGVERIYQIIGSSEPSVVDYSVDESVNETTPSLFSYVAKGGLAGGLVACALVLILFLSDTTLKSEDDILRYLRMPVLCSVPVFTEEKAKISEENNHSRRPAVSHYAHGKEKQESDENELDRLFQNLLAENGMANSEFRCTTVQMSVGKLPFAAAEAMNILRGSIQLKGADLKTIAVTSSLPHEGKSTVAFRLAKSMAGLRKRILFIDCDIRNSDFCERYQVKGVKKGLSEYLRGSVGKEQILCHTDDRYLDVICTGDVVSNPSELISGMLFAELISFARSVYDYVIVDTPPLNTVIDGLLITKRCDGTVLVVESGVTDRMQADRARRQMIYAEFKPLGVVLNKVQVHKGRYGYGYGYGYYGYGNKRNKKRHS